MSHLQTNDGQILTCIWVHCSMIREIAGADLFCQVLSGANFTLFQPLCNCPYHTTMNSTACQLLVIAALSVDACNNMEAFCSSAK